MAAGGAQRQLALLCRAQVDLGCEVHVALRAGGISLSLLETSGAHLHWLSVRSNHDPRTIFDISEAITLVRPHIVQTWIPTMDVFGGIACFFRGQPWVCSERSGEGWYDVRSLRNRVRHWIGSKANAIVANSPSGVRFWRSLFPNSKTIHCIPNIVKPPEVELAVERQLRERFRFIAVGRLLSTKGFVEMIRLFAAAVSECAGSDSELLIVGDGPEREPLLTLIEREKLRGRVSMVGEVHDVWPYLLGADAFLSFSRSEGMPNVVLEAAAVGLPLILSDIPAHRDLFDESEAWFVNVDQPDLAIGVLVSFMSKMDPKDRVVRAKSKMALLSPYRIGELYLALYRKLL
jgi:glycosyltransferase involved in cell wall biosynthesis